MLGDTRGQLAQQHSVNSGKMAMSRENDQVGGTRGAGGGGTGGGGKSWAALLSSNLPSVWNKNV